MIELYLAEIQLFENLNIEKITFKVVQIKFLAMHVTNTIFLLVFIKFY